LIVEAYIQRWATNILTLKNAERNVSNQQEINKMVEEYRQRLMIHNYQQEMVSEKVKLPTEIEAKQFYESNKELFLLEDAVIKGAIIKVPNNIKTDNIQRKFKNLNENIADIEKYALQYATDYVLFTEYWRLVGDVINTETSKLKINKIGYYEEKDSLHLMLINVTEYLPQGEVAPFEMIKEDVQTMLYNQHKMDYLNNFEKEMFEYGVRHNQIKINRE
jgi:sulfur relay (sulfurtransferase) complex TusBCD TusD component (DsrE family)